MNAVTLRAPWRALAMVTLALSMTGCASMAEKDPYEKFNRSMFTFNDAVDRNALKPAATAYKTVTPGFLQIGVNNFFGNLADVWSGANNLMQGKGERGLSDFTRVIINSTFGLAGVIDWASDAGLQKHNEDFGQTLGYWGMPSGPYVMLPLLGPSTLRDTAALPIDIAADPWGYGISGEAQAAGVVLRVVDQRAVLLDATNLMEEAALDRYEFIRDGYLQQRKGRVFDGEDSRKAAKEAREDEVPNARGILEAYEDEEAPVESKQPVSSETPAK
ncbi:VacJ family lipoprotein [Massilia sp. PAMC28688]|uniref:MlaA family lipoprotein n=1 Tax=Massilia sp. PAMC28688 TaxID=2861283 RepID=UPI001C6343C8|nr:VacJ family lipoprotein [Massilia sp. PAMC28688]QYF95328.1 VacJ family lipoprotein [Massilia sp. PAMC28688]